MSDALCGGGHTSGQVTFIEAPDSLSATTLHDGSITVLWPFLSNASYYEIERGTRLGDASTFHTIATTPGTSFIDASAAGPTAVTYIYRVRAVIGANRSALGPAD